MAKLNKSKFTCGGSNGKGHVLFRSKSDECVMIVQDSTPTDWGRWYVVPGRWFPHHKGDGRGRQASAEAQEAIIAVIQRRSDGQPRTTFYNSSVFKPIMA